MSETKPVAIRLTTEEQAALNKLAAKTNSVAKAGINAGKPSWRTMIRDIANGRLTVSKQ